MSGKPSISCPARIRVLHKPKNAQDVTEQEQSYSVRSFQQSLHSRDLIDQRNVGEKRVDRRPRRLREVRTVEWVSVVQILDAILHRGHGSVATTCVLQLLNFGRNSFEVIMRSASTHHPMTGS